MRLSILYQILTAAPAPSWGWQKHLSILYQILTGVEGGGCEDVGCVLSILYQILTGACWKDWVACSHLSILYQILTGLPERHNPQRGPGAFQFSIRFSLQRRLTLSAAWRKLSILYQIITP